jgi:hypothetical protein
MSLAPHVQAVVAKSDPSLTLKFPNSGPYVL